MASLLAEYDWENLEGESFVSVLKVLCIALQERYIIGRMTFNGVITGNPFHVPTHASMVDIFPYGNNDPKYMEDSWPLHALNNDIKNLIDFCADEYIDKDELDGVLGESPTSSANIKLYSLGQAAQDSAYPNRLMELAGYEDYPDVTVGAAAELKKIFDILCLLKWVSRSHSAQWQNSPAGDNDTEYTGEFDLDQGKFFEIDEDGADFYGDTNYRNASTDTGGYSNFKSGHDNLMDSGSNTHLQSEQGDNTYNLDTSQRYMFRFVTIGDAPNLPVSTRGYRNWIYALKIKEVYDWEPARDALGFTGKPNQVEKYNYINDSGSGSTMAHTGFSHTPDPTEELRKCTSTFTDIDENNHTVEYDDNLSLASLPASIPSENDTSLVYVSMFHRVTIENWNHAGGFLTHTNF